MAAGADMARRRRHAAQVSRYRARSAVVTAGGGVNPMEGVTIDAASGEYTPLTEAECETVLSAGGVAAPSVTNLYLFGTPASGNVSDVFGGKNLTAAGTWSYQQTVAGWTIKSAKTSAGTAATFSNATFANVNATNYTIFLLAKVATVAVVTKTLFQIGANWDDTATIEINTTPRMLLGEGDGTRSTGGADPCGVVRWFVLRVNDTGNTIDAFTSQEKLVGGTNAANGGTLLFGGDNNNSNFPATCDYIEGFVAAGALTDAEIHGSLTALDLNAMNWSP
jgi:hypothetical protein